MKLVLATALAAASLASHPAQAASSGQFTLNGETQEFAEVSAFRVRDRNNIKEFMNFVLLTAEAPDREAISQSSDPFSVAINDPATSGAHLMLFVKADGTISMNAHFDGVQYLDSTGEIMMAPGSLTGSCTTNTSERVACQVSSPESVESANGSTWSMNAEFDLAVLSRPAGKPLEDDGGAPGEAFGELVSAMGGDDLEAILALLPEERAEGYRDEYQSPEENLSDVKSYLSNSVPSKARITEGEYVSDDEAWFFAEGVIEAWGEDELIFEITMVRSGENWVFEFGRFVGFVE